MSRVTVINELKIYEKNGQELALPVPELRVVSHWNRKDFVLIRLGDEAVTVVASDLQVAIRNATNTE